MGTEIITKEEDRVVYVNLMYNIFDPTSFVSEELVYQSGQSLAKYIEGLPESCEWKVALNAVPVEPEDYDEVILAEKDLITIVAVPRDGSGGKDILRLAALLALVVVAAVVLGPGVAGVFSGLGLTGTTFAVAFAVTVAVGSYLINMALPPTGLTGPKELDLDDGQSYGYDGAKNTAKEGTPLPVVYGNFNVGGNYVDVFTKDVGDDQYLYGRLVLSDGEIDSLTGSPTLNDLPISDYTGVQWGYTQGKLTEPVNNYFNRTIAQFARSAKLDATWVQYTTTQSIDAFSLEFVMPRGLVGYDDQGNKLSEKSVIQIQYAPYGTTDWAAPGIISNPYTGTTGTGGSGYTCVTYDTILPNIGAASNVKVGDALNVTNPTTFQERQGLVSFVRQEVTDCVRISTQSGIQLECSLSAPIATESGECVLAPDLLDKMIPVCDNGEYRIEQVTLIEKIGLKSVVHITCENDFFLAGKEQGRYMLHHNTKPIEGLGPDYGTGVGLATYNEEI